MTRGGLSPGLPIIGLLLSVTQCSPAPKRSVDVPPSAPAASQQETAAGLAGTSWRLVQFEGGDGTILTPDDKATYTIAFGTDGGLNARIDCNRGRGTWKSSAPPQLEFGPLALTRAKCPPQSLHDHIVKQWPYVRSYVIQDGHLFLSLMADGGIYELEPTGQKGSVATGSLENTSWKLTHLGSSPVAVAPRQREPHLILNSVTRRVGGSGGCNQMSGSYEVTGDRLKLGPLTTTLMACAEGMETEKAFLGALERASRWKIAGQRLELSDAAGNVLAGFARHM